MPPVENLRIGKIGYYNEYSKFGLIKPEDGGRAVRFGFELVDAANFDPKKDTPIRFTSEDDADGPYATYMEPFEDVFTDHRDFNT